jgi:hypothetical protein
MMQITSPAPTAAQLWDWTTNVDKGTALFAEKVSGARAYPGQVRSSSGFTNIVNRTNQWRQSQGRPPLVQVIVPDFQNWQIDEDAVRGYNGWPNPDRQRGQFGLPWHEFRLQTQMVNGTVEILVVQNERTDSSGRLVADAVWIRVPVNERPPVGDRNYVENVRNKLATCP